MGWKRGVGVHKGVKQVRREVGEEPGSKVVHNEERDDLVHFH